MITEDDSGASEQELRVLTQILENLTKVDPESRQRILDTVVTYFRINRSSNAALQSAVIPRLDQTSAEPGGSFSQDRSISPKQFIFQKQPKTDVEKVACLGACPRNSQLVM
jgi:hypothetical protein